MSHMDLITKNPLRGLYPAEGSNQADHSMGLIMARAGLGKTAILVQIALDNMFRGKKVLHVNIGEGMDKTKAWYADAFSHISEHYKVDNVPVLQDETMRNRMIMTFKESSFSRPKLEERLNDLVYQNIFRPDCIVIDGFDFAATNHEAVEDLKELMSAMNVTAWFTALCHRDDDRVSAAGIPAPCHEMDDLFETVIVLQPEPEAIKLNIVKNDGGSGNAGQDLRLDPATMMIEGC